MNPLIYFAVACNGDFFGLVPWYKYLPTDPTSCRINLDLAGGGLPKLWLIGVAVLEDLLRIAGIVAVFFVIYGGIKYLNSWGAPENTKAARDTILNALIGLGIAVIGAAAVGFIGGKLGG